LLSKKELLIFAAATTYGFISLADILSSMNPFFSAAVEVKILTEQGHKPIPYKNTYLLEVSKWPPSLFSSLAFREMWNHARGYSFEEAFDVVYAILLSLDLSGIVRMATCTLQVLEEPGLKRSRDAENLSNCYEKISIDPHHVTALITKTRTNLILSLTWHDHIYII